MDTEFAGVAGETAIKKGVRETVGRPDTVTRARHARAHECVIVCVVMCTYSEGRGIVRPARIEVLTLGGVEKGGRNSREEKGN